MKLAVLASGEGSLLSAMLAQQVPVSLVVTDRHCPAYELGVRSRIPSIVYGRSSPEGPFDRTKYTLGMLKLLREEHIDLVAMTGFMTVFSKEMFARGAYEFKMLNIHPSLLPSFKGAHAVRDALDAGVKVTGCTIHVAAEELDSGPILVQEPVRVLPGDTPESLHERIKTVERMVYPMYLKHILCM